MNFKLCFFPIEFILSDKDQESLFKLIKRNISIIFISYLSFSDTMKAVSFLKGKEIIIFAKENKIYDASTDSFKTFSNLKEIISYIKNHFQLKKENILTFANEYETLPFYYESGYSICTSDAPIFIKLKANFVTKKLRDDGISFAMKKILK